MASIEAFESALKEVVGARKLSQSKMSTLTEVALKSMDNDTQMVSILYRTHKSLSPSAKVWSLYAFDALARAARNRVNKNHITGNLTSEKGNCATFLLRIEGILDGLFQDLILSGSDELKEKAKKILDIWTKSNTFSSAVLSPLYALLKQAEKDKEPDQADTTNVAFTEPSAPALPPSQLSTSKPPATPLVNVDAVQSTLLALLSKAASNGGTTSTTVPISSQIAPNNVPLALLQQLAQTAQGNAAPSQPVPVSASVVPSLTTPNAVPVPQSFPYRDDHYESEHDHFNGPERGFPRDNHNDPHRDFRGGARDHGRGGRGRGRWGDRERLRDRSREFQRDLRPRRSRSRSPPGRYGGPGPRDARQHRYSQEHRAGLDGRAPAGPQAGKDEFGRDLRAESPQGSDSAASPAPPRAKPVIANIPSFAPSYSHAYTGGPSATLSISPSTSTAPASSEEPPVEGKVGLDAFDLTTFDPVQAASWEALGKAWAVTHGSMPTQEQLMQFVFSNMPLAQPQASAQAGAPPNRQQLQPSQQSQPQQYTQQPQYEDAGQYGRPGQERQWNAPQGPRAGWRGRAGGAGSFSGPGRGQARGRGDFGRGHGRGEFGRRGFGREGRGRGDHEYGNGRGAYNAVGRGYQEEETDAVTLSGGDDYSWQEQQQQGYPGEPYGNPQQSLQSPPPHSQHPQRSPPQNQDSPSQQAQGVSAAGGSAGKMQKVGDKWVFVRGAV
ncbi:hypothetical protein BD414DRAFT_520330 [Trametes punicea]|nr:hypothetical protein BD414DRAFT_520330 [Trametes punicea]